MITCKTGRRITKSEFHIQEKNQSKTNIELGEITTHLLAYGINAKLVKQIKDKRSED